MIRLIQGAQTAAKGLLCTAYLSPLIANASDLHFLPPEMRLCMFKLALLATFSGRVFYGKTPHTPRSLIIVFHVLAQLLLTPMLLHFEMYHILPWIFVWLLLCMSTAATLGKCQAYASTRSSPRTRRLLLGSLFAGVALGGVLAPLLPFSRQYQTLLLLPVSAVVMCCPVEAVDELDDLARTWQPPAPNLSRVSGIALLAVCLLRPVGPQGLPGLADPLALSSGMLLAAVAFAVFPPRAIPRGTQLVVAFLTTLLCTAEIALLGVESSELDPLRTFLVGAHGALGVSFVLLRLSRSGAHPVYVLAPVWLWGCVGAALRVALAETELRVAELSAAALAFLLELFFVRQSWGGDPDDAEDEV